MKTSVLSLVLFFLFTTTYANTNQDKKEEIPAAVNATLQKDFSNYEVVSFKLKKKKEDTLYKFELKSSKDSYKVLIDSKGNIIKKEEIIEIEAIEEGGAKNNIKFDMDAE